MPDTADARTPDARPTRCTAVPSRHNCAHERLQSATTETAVVDKPAEEDDHAGHHHGHAH
ncbi:hypothetical protein FZI95_05685 [Mycobacterium sp. CBMA247]|nr:hypothetical protein [Mycolicibacterium sp. CBMA 329]MUL87028.1 hypothetical protein [Mycolicibacterium sp. CBMA 331]MUL98689.1 hypothetical protein [Mycolicibacterium sp. CBMA 334]MUM25552.1 hypothetical protein [Mycolicibacterium sp. CBMA 295]MUM37325.1 hypothetical protein [Mycolicibacterium sp. CBMA 247]MUM43093.1 hypothetical protein [Mycolicibacterium sp. CBMA 294]